MLLSLKAAIASQRKEYKKCKIEASLQKQSRKIYSKSKNQSNFRL